MYCSKSTIFVGLSTTFMNRPTINFIINQVEKIKKVFPNIKLIVGGTAISSSGYSNLPPYTNKSINLEIFSFSNVNQTLLVLSILFLYLQRSTTLSLNFFNAFFISLILFWLYGIKETNIFFFPLLFFFKIFRENLTLILNIVFFCI